MNVKYKQPVGQDPHYYFTSETQLSWLCQRGERTKEASRFIFTLLQSHGIATVWASKDYPNLTPVYELLLDGINMCCWPSSKDSVEIVLILEVLYLPECLQKLHLVWYTSTVPCHGLCLQDLIRTIVDKCSLPWFCDWLSLMQMWTSCGYGGSVW